MVINIKISGPTIIAQSFHCSDSDIKINFNDPNKIIAAANTGLNSGLGQGQFYSTDGGFTWAQTNLPFIQGDQSHSDPCVDWTSDGTAWSITIGIDINGKQTLRSYRSPDKGASWIPDPDPMTSMLPPPSGAKTAVDRPSMWSDHSPNSPNKDCIYVLFANLENNNLPAYVGVRDTNGIWRTPIKVSDSQTQGSSSGGDIKTNGVGHVFAFWPDTVSQQIFFAKSIDSGSTFSTPQAIARTIGSGELSIPAAPRVPHLSKPPAINVSGGVYSGATDFVYAIWTDLNSSGCTPPDQNINSDCKTRIWFARSTDGGINWENPSMINDNSSTRNDQFNPRLAVDETNGQLAVIYYDTNNDPNRVNTNVWMQISDDNGVTWRNPLLVTSASTNERSAGAGFDYYGDNNGLSGYNGVFFSSWTDRRDGGNEEIWSAPIPTTILNTLKKCSIITDRSTFGRDEIDVQGSSPPVTYDSAFYVIVDGFRPVDLGITPADFSGIPIIQPTVPIPPNLTQMSWSCTKLIADDPSHLLNPQRLTWIFQIHFQGDSDFPSMQGAINQVTLIATDPTGIVSSDQGNIQLIYSANPFEIDGPVWYLSTDILVFRIIPNALLPQGSPPVTLTGTKAIDCNLFIGNLINAFNLAPPTNAPGTLPGYIHPFDLMQQAISPDLSLSSQENGNLVFNFAFARVRCRTSQDVPNLRVFFRLFPALTTSTGYDQNTTDPYAVYHRSGGPLPLNTDMQPIPLLGIDNQNNIISIPFFAEPRVVADTQKMTEQRDPLNVQPILASRAVFSGAEIDTFFGCWLDFNQPFDLRFPLQPSPPAIGPFPTPAAGVNYSIQELIANAHQCLVAEIAYDPAKIPPGVSPAMSDKLAQRNLSFVGSANPGNLASHRIPNTFDIKSTRATLQPNKTPDELMIDWGNTPLGSLATIYLPGVSVTEVLKMASKMYLIQKLKHVDDHTLQCSTGGITYIPVPVGIGNFTGLITIDLPPTVKLGQTFKIVVRQVTNAFTERARQTDIALTKVDSSVAVSRNWRIVSGAFQITIPVMKKETLLGPEEQLLSVLRWIEEKMPSDSRWYLVFRRYVSQIADRVGGFGGDPNIIGPSPSGEWQKPKTRNGEGIEFTGKVAGLIFDRFGDFEGFLLDSDDGERKFFSHEKDVEKLAERAWLERLRITVWVECKDLNKPLRIIVRQPPVSFDSFDMKGADKKN